MPSIDNELLLMSVAPRLKGNQPGFSPENTLSLIFFPQRPCVDRGSCIFICFTGNKVRSKFRVRRSFAEVNVRNKVRFNGFINLLTFSNTRLSSSPAVYARGDCVSRRVFWFTCEKALTITLSALQQPTCAGNRSIEAMLFFPGIML